LKNKILENFADAEQQTDGRNVVIFENNAMLTLIKEALFDRNCNTDS